MDLIPDPNVSDEEIVQRLLAREEKTTEYVFYTLCRPMFNKIVQSIFHNELEYQDVVGEFWRYLEKEDFSKLRKFDFRSKLTTWLSVVATRFFLKNKARLLKIPGVKESEEVMGSIEAPSNERYRLILEIVQSAIKQIKNKQYREVLDQLLIQELGHEEIIKRMGIKLSNLYNIKSRGLKELLLILGEEGKRELYSILSERE